MLSAQDGVELQLVDDTPVVEHSQPQEAEAVNPVTSTAEDTSEALFADTVCIPAVSVGFCDP